MKIIIDIDEKDYEFIKSVRSIMKNSDTFERLATDLFLSVKNSTSVEPEITNDDLQAAMTESYHLGYELAETKFKRPQGKWIKHEWGYSCSVCGVSNDYAYDNNIHKFTDYFCPNCGADMKNKGE